MVDEPIQNAMPPDVTTEETTDPAADSSSSSLMSEASSELSDGQDANQETTHEGFSVRLDNFEGPFDLLLQLISRHKLDITEVALSQVTDEFIAHIKAMGNDWDLDQTSQFVVVGSTLLDLKAARLLPSGEMEDPEDLELLEARDLLFARLLQYRAFKQVADQFEQMLQAQARRLPRTAGPDPQFLQLLPELHIPATPERLAELAAAAMKPKPEEPGVDTLGHLHAPVVSVREQAELVIGRLRNQGECEFGELVGDAPDNLTTVCRFLALLELFREQAVAFEQPTPLGRLTIRWAQTFEHHLTISDEFDTGANPAPEQSGSNAQPAGEQADDDQVTGSLSPSNATDRSAEFDVTERVDEPSRDAGQHSLGEDDV